MLVGAYVFCYNRGRNGGCEVGPRLTILFYGRCLSFCGRCRVLAGLVLVRVDYIAVVVFGVVKVLRGTDVPVVGLKNLYLSESVKRSFRFW